MSASPASIPPDEPECSAASRSAEAGTAAHADNQRLVDQYTEIATLAGGLAHEIKNPLSTIRLNMELLAEDFADAQSQRDRRALNKIRMVERECERLQNLLDDFLRFARARALSFEPASVNEELTRLVEFFRPQANEHGIEVVEYFDPDLPDVPLDREMFRAALMNIMLNAQQAMPEGGQIVLRTHESPGEVVIEIIDSGCGMDRACLSKVFRAFYSTKPGGSGLGLPTTRKIIEGHGGRIDVQSEPGRGTQFTIRLPRAAAAVAAPRTP